MQMPMFSKCFLNQYLKNYRSAPHWWIPTAVNGWRSLSSKTNFHFREIAKYQQSSRKNIASQHPLAWQKILDKTWSSPIKIWLCLSYLDCFCIIESSRYVVPCCYFEISQLAWSCVPGESAWLGPILEPSCLLSAAEVISPNQRWWRSLLPRAIRTWWFSLSFCSVRAY